MGACASVKLPRQTTRRGKAYTHTISSAPHASSQKSSQKLASRTSTGGSGYYRKAQIIAIQPTKSLPPPLRRGQRSRQPTMSIGACDDCKCHVCESAQLIEESLQKIRQSNRCVSMADGGRTCYVVLYDVFFKALTNKPTLLTAFFGVSLKERAETFTVFLDAIPEALLRHQHNSKHRSSRRLVGHTGSNFARLCGRKKLLDKLYADDLPLLKKALVASLTVVVPSVTEDTIEQTAIIDAWTKGLAVLMQKMLHSSYFPRFYTSNVKHCSSQIPHSSSHHDLSSIFEEKKDNPCSSTI